jgi:hypothetical protein
MWIFNFSHWNSNEFHISDTNISCVTWKISLLFISKHTFPYSNLLLVELIKKSVWISWEDKFLSESHWPKLNTHCPLPLTLYNNKTYTKSFSMLGIVGTERLNLLVRHAVSPKKAGIFCDVMLCPHRRTKSSGIWCCVLTEGLNLLERYEESRKRLRYSATRYESLKSCRNTLNHCQ